MREFSATEIVHYLSVLQQSPSPTLSKQSKYKLKEILVILQSLILTEKETLSKNEKVILKRHIALLVKNTNRVCGKVIKNVENQAINEMLIWQKENLWED